MILTQEQEMIRDSMRAFAQERLAPFAAEWDREHTFPAEALKELGELGAMGMVVPEQWGGAGMDYMSLVLTLEEIAARVGEVPKDRPVAIICNTGLRAYDSLLVLARNGVTDVVNSAGGMQAAIKMGLSV